MGFFLSILYFGIHYLTPAFLYGPLAAAHIEVILAALLFFVSVPALLRSFIFKTPQSLAMIGLACAVFLSRAIGGHWLGGGFRYLLDFLPNALSYFFLCLHCTTKLRLRVLVLMMFSVCVIVIAHGYADLIHGVAESGPPPGVGLGTPDVSGETASPYLFKQINSEGKWTYRLQGLGEINDPNDFAQLMVCLVPLLFISWRPKNFFNNLVFVLLPVCILLFGIFLTHSRGSLVALTTMAIVIGRRRIGTIPAALLAGCLFASAMAFHFTGDRDISASAGEDRTSLWGQGMQVLKDHPVFGVGYGDLWEYTDGNLTAHNSVIVCASETGIFGLFFWSLFLFPTVRDSLELSSPERTYEAQAAEAEDESSPFAPQRLEDLDKDEINRLGRVIFFSLTGFLVAGWFLSRAFAATLFMLGGIAESVYEMAVRRGMVSQRLPFPRVLRFSAGLAVCLIVAMYIIVRALNFVH